MYISVDIYVSVHVSEPAETEGNADILEKYCCSVCLMYFFAAVCPLTFGLFSILSLFLSPLSFFAMTCLFYFTFVLSLLSSSSASSTPSSITPSSSLLWVCLCATVVFRRCVQLICAASLPPQTPSLCKYLSPCVVVCADV